MENHVKIKALRIFAKHGVLPQERSVGAWFIVDVDLTLSFVQAMLADVLAGTVNYAEIYEVVYGEMQRPNSLIECVGGRIVHALFDRFPQVERIHLELTKETPPISGIQCAGCCIGINIGRKECEQLYSQR